MKRIFQICTCGASVLVFSAVALFAREPLTVPSNLMVDQEVSVTARVSGVIDAIIVHRGQRVLKGQALATLDSREFLLDRNVARENFKVAEADYHRYQELFNEKLASRAEFEQREARYEQAQVQLKQAELVIDRSTIRAPFDGVVVDLFARVGQKVLVDESAPLFKVSALAPLLARVYLPESALHSVLEGEGVEISAVPFPKAKARGRVTFVSPVIDPGSGAFQVIVRVTGNAGRVLRPGMAVNITFPGK